MGQAGYFEKIRVFKAGPGSLNIGARNNERGPRSCFCWFLKARGNDRERRTGASVLNLTKLTDVPRSLTHARAAGPCETRRRSEGEAPSAGEQGVILRKKAQRRPISVVPTTRSRKSASVRTRKMVNYAWAGRSQRKLWWRAAAILTCKSIVRPGHRGERLIEPSSSWFPPKFPSG